MSMVRFFLLASVIVAGVLGPASAEDGAWEKVQKILMGTKDNVVFDGTEPVPLRDESQATPEPGDWLVRHMLSDPEKLNPFT